jgi:hypothetical protein
MRALRASTKVVNPKPAATPVFECFQSAASVASEKLAPNWEDDAKWQRLNPRLKQPPPD